MDTDNSMVKVWDWVEGVGGKRRTSVILSTIKEKKVSLQHFVGLVRVITACTEQNETTLFWKYRAVLFFSPTLVAFHITLVIGG